MLTWQNERGMNMKKILCLALLVALAVILCACDQPQTGNRVTYGRDVQTFTYAYIYLGNEKLVEGYITQWRDYNNSDTIQLMIDGKYYLTHYANVVMIADPSKGNLGYDNAGRFGIDE